MSETNLQKTTEWAAGLFEGEGSIVIRPSRIGSKSGNLTVSLVSTDKDVVRWFHRVVGFGKIRGPYQYGKNKPYWQWSAENDAGCSVLIELLPYLCSRRKKRAKEALRANKERLSSPYYRVSRKGMGGRPTHKGEVR
jgi:hypothetical protein